MLKSDLSKGVAGIVAWLLVAVLAVITVEFWGGFWGALPVLVAVVAMWLIGERVLASSEEVEQ